MNEQQRLLAKRHILQLRCEILQLIRKFFLEQGFLEVQTPLRTREPLPELHINAVGCDGWYLITSPESHMKRMVAAGYNRIYQICKVFREGESGRFHHPEFTILEWYQLGDDYSHLKKNCQMLLTKLCKALDRYPTLTYQGHTLEVRQPWCEYTVREAFLRWAGWDPTGSEDCDRFELDLVEHIEPHLGFPTPCFLKDYPKEYASLARLKPDNPLLADRIELYWAGIELANGFVELTDPEEQRKRFILTNRERQRRGLPPYPLPEAFLQSLCHLPPCVGMALGVDRLVMILADVHHIDQVVAFPPVSG